MATLHRLFAIDRLAAPGSDGDVPHDTTATQSQPRGQAAGNAASRHDGSNGSATQRLQASSNALPRSSGAVSTANTNGSPPSQGNRITLQISGMHCAGCVARVEKALTEVEGVQSVAISLTEGSARVTGDRLDPARLAEVVKQRGFDAAPVAPRAKTASVAEQRTALEDRQHRTAVKWRNRVIVGLCAWIPLGIIHWAGKPLGWYSGHHPEGLLLWLQVALAFTILIYVGGLYYASAWKAAKAKSTNMDTLIAIGSTAAFLLSLFVTVLTVLGHHAPFPLYYGEAAGLLTLISVGHWLEARTTAAAGSAVRELLQLQPDEVTRLPRADADPATEATRGPSADVEVGEFMLIRPGERVAVDGRIARGASTLDESVVTGESMPVERQVGDAVVAGALNISGRIVVQATTDGRHTTVARIAELVREAQTSKARIQKLVDRISAVFVPAVISIAACTLVGWLLYGYVFAPSEAAAAADAGADSIPAWVVAVVNATTVLVISCPCALGLATPTAVMVASGAASRRGVLVKSAVALERSSHVDVMVFDKTGTLTAGRPEVVSATNETETLTLAAAVASGSNHPLSRAIVEAWRTQVAGVSGSDTGVCPPPADDVSEEAGRGVRGTVRGEEIAVLSPAAAAVRYPQLKNALQADGAGSAAASTARTESVVIRNGAEVVGRIAFEDALREDVPAVVQQLRELGIRPLLASGDRVEVAQVIGARAGFRPDEIHGGLSPEDKVQLVRSLTQAPRPGTAADARKRAPVVAMVGDGINDAAALAEAGAGGGIGVAIGAGANIAIESADVIIPGDDPHTIADVVRIGRSGMRTIRQNLFLAFVYNVCAIPAAALGLLGMSGPVIAAAAMGLSDFCVIGNSLRLRRRLRRLHG